MPERLLRAQAGWSSAGRGLAPPWLLSLLERLVALRDGGWVGYAIGVAAFGIALAARFALDSRLPSGFPFLTFFPAIVLSAFIAGRGPSIVCSVLSLLASWYWFIPPRQSFALDAQSAVAVAFFAFIAIVNVWVIDVMTASLARLEQAQRRADELAQQRTLLFHELQHRVANTLTMVGTVLSAQQRLLPHNPEAVTALKAARERLDLMARLHRRMHDPAAADQPLQTYLQDLVGDFVRAQGRSDIAVDVQASDAVRGLDRRTTLGLLVLELVTNALKHAFPPPRSGRLVISLQADAPGPDSRSTPSHWLLRVADDGIGLPPGHDAAASERLGMKIAHGLARSLRGELVYVPREAGQGTCVEVRFAQVQHPAAAGTAHEGDGTGGPAAAPLAPTPRGT